jgi:hypothetical protein
MLGLQGPVTLTMTSRDRHSLVGDLSRDGLADLLDREPLAEARWRPNSASDPTA